MMPGPHTGAYEAVPRSWPLETEQPWPVTGEKGEQMSEMTIGKSGVSHVCGKS
jgi:hypothetical protein